MGPAATVEKGATLRQVTPTFPTWRMAAMQEAIRGMKRLFSVFLVGLALAVAANWIATPLYHDGSADYPVWEILNWLMLVAVTIALIKNFCYKCSFDRQGSDGTITRRYLEVNLAFYASIVLALWYYWNFFASLLPDNESAVVGIIHLEMWAWVNPLFVLVSGVTGVRLWRDASRQ